MTLLLKMTEKNSQSYFLFCSNLMKRPMLMAKLLKKKLSQTTPMVKTR